MQQMMDIQIADTTNIPNIYKIYSQVLIHLFNKYLVRIYLCQKLIKTLEMYLGLRYTSAKRKPRFQ